MKCATCSARIIVARRPRPPAEVVHLDYRPASGPTATWLLDAGVAYRLHLPYDVPRPGVGSVHREHPCRPA